MPRLHADGVELFYESLGEGTPLILQAHDHTPWLFFQAPVFSQTYRFVTFDRRGTGRSASPPGGWSIADFARDLRGLMDALGIERAIVGGSSLGGIISAQFALDYPDRVLAVIVGHTTPYFWDLAREWVLELLQDAHPNLGPQPRSYAWEDDGPPTTNPAFAESSVGKLMASIGTGLGRDADSVRKMHYALLGWDQRPRYAELHALRVPALFIVGANEPQKTVELMCEWQHQVPASELVICATATTRRTARMRWRGTPPSSRFYNATTSVSSHPTWNVWDTGQANSAIVLGVTVDRHLGADRPILDLKAEHATVFQLELAAQERMRIEDVVVRGTRGHHDLNFAASDLDVDGFVTFSVVVE